MRRAGWWFMMGLVTLVLVFSACGGGDEGEKLVELCAVEYDHWEKTEPPLPEMSNLEGTYTLHSFDIDIWVDGVYLGMPLSSGDFASFSGTLELQDGTITETMTVTDHEGYSETAYYSGTYTVSSFYANAGTLHVTVLSETYDVICAMGKIMICDPACEEFFLVTLQHEMVCGMVPESELMSAAAPMARRSLKK